MSTVQIWQTNSTSSAETEKLGEKLGQHLKGGEVIELVSDLGGGKTTFVRGLARGMGSTDNVSSPTFTVTKVYIAGNLELHHFDLYRLGEAGLMAHELEDVLNDPQVVTVIEWANVAEHVLPVERVSISIKPLDENSRLIGITCPDPLKYLLEEL